MNFRISICGIAVLFSFGACSYSSGAEASCHLPPNYGIVKQVWCTRAHDCRASFALTDAEFDAQFGATANDCLTISSLPFVEAVRSAAGDAEDAGLPETDVYWLRLGNCATGLARASCTDFVGDAVLASGNFCGADVLGGTAPCPENLIASECGPPEGFEMCLVP